MNNELSRLNEQSTRIIYQNSDQPHIDGIRLVDAISEDDRYIKDKNIEIRNMKCNIPGVNTTSTIRMYYDKDAKTMCPAKGWCMKTNNIIDKNRITNIENSTEITTSISLETLGEGTRKELCPPCNPLLNLDYNTDCVLAKRDNDMVKALCADEMGDIYWKTDDDGKEYCQKNDNSPYKIYKDSSEAIQCDATDNNPNGHTAFKLYDTREQRTILCPKGYCSDPDGYNNLNTTNINKILDLEKHPFCSVINN
jgi:hypothetical protein